MSLGGVSLNLQIDAGRSSRQNGKKVFDSGDEFAIVIPAPNGWVAQLVEQGTENPRVRGSTPFPATRTFAGRRPCVSGLLCYRYHVCPQIGARSGAPLLLGCRRAFSPRLRQHVLLAPASSGACCSAPLCISRERARTYECGPGVRPIMGVLCIRCGLLLV